MNYELAKQLKDAGFPYSDKWELSEGRGATIEINNEQVMSVPTLGELIEECWDNFHGIFVVRADKVWTSHGYKSESEFDDIFCYGSTPEEAVANLWLNLNKK